MTILRKVVLVMACLGCVSLAACDMEEYAKAVITNSKVLGLKLALLQGND